MKVGDKVRLNFDLVTETYSSFLHEEVYLIERIKNDKVLLAYTDGFVPRQLRSIWFPITLFTVMLDRYAFDLGEHVKVNDCNGIRKSSFGRRSYHAKIGIVVQQSHIYIGKPMYRVRLDTTNEDIVIEEYGLEKIKQRKLPDWF